MDRMSPLDAAFLHLEDGINHMHIASCAIFQGPPPPYEDLVGLFRARVPLAPRYRQKVRFVPGAVGRPVWVDDPHFRIEYHLRHTALPAPGGDEDLRRLMGRLMSQQLDRHRPLWETWMVEGLADDRWALISKAHHCMVDGISGTDLLAVILDLSPQPAPMEVVDEWRPAPEPSDAELFRTAVLDTMASPYELARWARSALRTPRHAVEAVGATLAGARSAGGRLLPNRPLPTEGPIGPHRRWSWARTTLTDVKTIRQHLGGTVNDVVLSAITAGFRAFLLGRGEEVDGVVMRTLVPVSVRTPGDTTYNNQVSGMIAELPVGLADPVERLVSIREQLQGLKESHQAVAGSTIAELAGFAPPMLLALGLRTAVTVMRRAPQRSVNTVTTNVPGPQFPLYACGRQMLEYFPYVPVFHGMRIGVAVLSYNGQLGFGVTADYDSVPDVEVVSTGIEIGMSELLAACAGTVATASAGSSRRR